MTQTWPRQFSNWQPIVREGGVGRLSGRRQPTNEQAPRQEAAAVFGGGSIAGTANPVGMHKLSPSLPNLVLSSERREVCQSSGG